MTVAPELQPNIENRATESEASPATLDETLARLKAGHRAHPMPTYEERIDHLDRLQRALLRHKFAICDAITRDFGNRSRHESLVAEVYLTLQGIKHARRHLREWMEPQPREVGAPFLPATAEVRIQPLGVVGIISPWNYPVQLAFGPLIGVLAAGNRAMLKPSELVPQTAELMKNILADTFAPDHVAVVTGGADVGEAFAGLPFDHLVFTGSTRVGKLVMRAAAANLTPVTLELGGKSPAIVGADCSIETAAGRIMAAKLFNAGQTCIAPDYALVPEPDREAFVTACRAAVLKMYRSFTTNDDYTSIVSDGHYRRLTSYLEDAKSRDANIIELNTLGEPAARTTRKLIPALVLDPTDEMLVMQDEIFGPILPIVTYKTLDDAIGYVNDHPRPLALYYFGHNRKNIERVIEQTISGGVCINDAMIQFAQEDLPFGGVGASGMGHYHAAEGFETFSKKKPVIRQSKLAATPLLKPPHGMLMGATLKLLVR